MPIPTAWAQACTSNTQCLTGQYCRDTSPFGDGNGVCTALSPTPLPAITCPANFGSCSANDLVINAVLANPVNGDTCADGQLDVQVSIEYQSTANQRYDVGFFIARDGAAFDASRQPPVPSDCSGNAASVGNGDLHAFLGDTDSDLFLNLDGDACGDIDTTNGPVRWTVSETVSCVTNASGNLLLETGFVWNQNAQGVCTGLANVGTGSKCRTDSLPLPGLIYHDHGDAPASYGDAIHVSSVGFAGDLYIGNVIPDIETAAPGGLSASGDDDLNDDEDGTSFDPIAPDTTTSYALGVTVTKTTADAAVLAVWLDLDCSGTFDASELRTIAVTTSGIYRVPVWDNGGSPFFTAAQAAACPVANTTFARVRLSNNPAFIASPTPTGSGGVGEVEDYRVVLATSTTPATVTEVALNSLASGGAAFSWLTASERATAAFRVERWMVNAAGQGHWKRVHRSAWIPAIMSLQGGHYQVTDTQAVGSAPYRYRIIEQPANDQRRVYGPYDLQALSGEPPLAVGETGFATRERFDFDRIVELEAYHSRQSAAGPKRHAGAHAGRVKLEIGETGIYALSAAELADYLGLSLGKAQDFLEAGQFHLSTGGEDVSWFADDAGHFYFFGESIDSPYSATRTYWLAEKGKGPRMQTTGVGDAGTVDASYVDLLEFEEDNLALLWSTDNPAEDIWFWEFLFPLDGFRTKLYDLDVPDQRAADGNLELSLFGTLDGVDHRVQVTANGVDVGPVDFSGSTRHTANLVLPASVFSQGSDDLQLELTLDNSPSGGFSLVYVDAMSVTYERGYRAFSDRIVYLADGATTVSGLTSDQVVILDVTAPKKPVWISGGAVEPDGATFTWRADLALGEYATAAGDGLLSPVSWVADVASKLTSKNNRADYVIIATDDLWPGAEALAEYRSLELETMIVNITDVYDEFAFGHPDPAATRELVRASRHWKKVPRYFVILGDGSFDYQRRLPFVGYNIINPELYGNRQGLHASDTLLGDIEGQGRPVAAFGRIPAKTVQEALDYVAKLAAYESGALGLPSLMLTDQPDEGGDFTFAGRRMSEAVEGVNITLDSQGKSFSEVKALLYEELYSGKRLVNYIGHGSTDRISKLGNGLLNNNDADFALDNTETPAFVGLSCLINNYSVAGWDSLGERLVMRAGAGMIASWAASGESYNLEATQLGIRFNERHQQHARLGDAILDALSSETLLNDVYTLLGDPAAKLNPPE